jgi:hypothetical protein
MRWEDWSRDEGGWTKAIKLADDLPNIKVVIGPGEHERGESVYPHIRAFVVAPEHPLCPEFTGEEGLIGNGSPVLETWWEEWPERRKRDALAQARMQVERSLTIAGERAATANCLRDELKLRAKGQ